jgi:hypothetical protein
MSAAYALRVGVWEALRRSGAWHERDEFGMFTMRSGDRNAIPHVLVSGRKQGGMTVAAGRPSCTAVTYWSQDFKPSIPDEVVVAAALAAAEWATR